MAAKPKKNLGKMPCPDCGQPVAVMQADTGTLSYKCQEADCEATGYAPAHTAAARKWHAALGTRQEPAAAPPKPADAPAPKAPASQEKKPDPDAPPRKGGFSLEGL